MKRFCMLVAALMCMTVRAQDAQHEVMEGYGRFPYRLVFSATSEPGQTLDEFALTLSKRLREFSDATGYEACAEIGTDGTQWSAIVGSNESHVACIVNEKRLAEGMRDSGVGIHSHGTNRPFNLNRSDMRLSETDPGSVASRWMLGQDVWHFSAADLDDAPGYLATPTGALYHDGYGKVSVVSLTPSTNPL